MENVTIVIPIYNEEYYIENLITSILKQDYDLKKVEVIFIDGKSTDNTLEIVKKMMRETKIDFKVIINTKKITPISVNIGIKCALYDIIMRLDAHSEYPKNYISKCIYYLLKTGADNVGCLIKTEGKGKIGRVISNVLSSSFGVGNSKFRINGKSGYTDTVPYGTFRKTLLDKSGYFNEDLIRSEDNEFNYRIIKNGGKVYLFNDIAIIYHPRNSILKLLKMAYQNGKWSLYTNCFIPGSMKTRHFVPFIFVLSLFLGTILMFTDFNILKILFLLELSLYMIFDFSFTLKHIFKDGISQIFTFFIYPLFHISYGIGSISGIQMILKRKD